MKIQPLGDRVLVKRIEEEKTEEKLASGIYVKSEKKTTLKNLGLVEAIGPKLSEKKEKGELKFDIGDKVLYSWGEKIDTDDGTFDIISESNVLAVVEE